MIKQKFKAKLVKDPKHGDQTMLMTNQVGQWLVQLIFNSQEEIDDLIKVLQDFDGFKQPVGEGGTNE